MTALVLIPGKASGHRPRLQRSFGERGARTRPIRDGVESVMEEIIAALMSLHLAACGTCDRACSYDHDGTGANIIDEESTVDLAKQIFRIKLAFEGSQCEFLNYDEHFTTV